MSKLTRFLPMNYSYLNIYFKLKKFFNHLNSDINYLTPLWMSSMNILELKEFFNQNLYEENFCEDYSKLSSNYLFEYLHLNSENSQLYFYKFLYLPFSVLFKTDFASMLNSVEYRSPFLSKRVINLSLSQDVSQLFNIFEKKN